ncbi:isochorismatase domain-containing protein 1-like [Teleopsis dalmanni]|uniref:isochorismatase domain-containing protein 1-like n=1 Tax=Teleopsis dalmanni TaxID=139649 RepID=UPI000D3295A5|nr:isochorismatase domain-containing protein 1-like [Teleopsis dalmanni]
MKFNFTKLNSKTTAFFLCDIQDKFRPAMPLFDSLIKNTSKLLKMGKALEVPLFVTEQYPEKLGRTPKELDISHACVLAAKTQFSMLVPELECKLQEVYTENKLTDVVIFGIEAHVCVEQTVLDLLNQDIRVHVVADCCCSRAKQDRRTALNLMRHLGGMITTSESICFNLLGNKNNPKFNAIRDLVKAVSEDMSEK